MKRPKAVAWIAYKCPGDGSLNNVMALRTYADRFGAEIVADVICNCGQTHSFDITVGYDEPEEGI